MLYWETEWKAWEEGHPRGAPLRLTPVLPVVFHTGAGPWRTNRTLAELIDAPEAFAVHIPSWQPLIWDLSEHTAAALQEADGAWMQALAVVRAEREESAAFQAVFAAVLRRLEPLSEQENVRWHDLVHFVLSWAFWRRPGAERPRLVAVAQESQTAAAHREEVTRVSETIARTWPEELLAQGLAEGLAEGEMRMRKEDLQILLEARFGALPEGWANRIEATQDMERLKNAMHQVIQIRDLAELDL